MPAIVSLSHFIPQINALTAEVVDNRNCMRKIVHWLTRSGEHETLRKTLAVFAGVLLSLTIIGIPIVILAFREWRSLETQNNKTLVIDRFVKVILIHGSAGGKPTHNWIPYVKTELEKMEISVVAPQFPDNNLARASYWIPFLHGLHPNEKTILIGHSSGAIASMRFAEKNKILGSVLVGSYYTNLGLENERISGYFDTPWDWEAIKNNQEWIIQFASRDDPWIPIEEPRFIRDRLSTEYHEFHDQGHYCKSDFPELVNAIKDKLHQKTEDCVCKCLVLG